MKILPKQIKIVAISDVHLGNGTGKTALKKICGNDKCAASRLDTD